MIYNNRGWLLIGLALTVLILSAAVWGCSKSPPDENSSTSVSPGASGSPSSFSIVQSATSPYLTVSGAPASGPTPSGQPRPAASPGNKGQLSPDSYSMYFSTNQKEIEGYYSKELDLRDVDAVFWAVFSRLPPEVMVYPSENYYYFSFDSSGREIWGNIRLPAGRRELGELSFAYFDYDEFDYAPGAQFTRAKLYNAGDGVIVKEVDNFTYIVTYNNKSVTFNLLRIPQNPPRLFRLERDEAFVMREMDDSGYQFFLIFNETKKYFFWVLNEENGVPDTLDPFGNYNDIYRGRRSGFVFWEDLSHDGRKVLVSVRQQSVERNDHFDGPFDQLADNYANETRISEYIGKASPTLAGKIDKYGYFLEGNVGMRVALSMYFTHYYDAQVLEFIKNFKSSDDPTWYISRRGLPPYIPPTITPAPVATPPPSSPVP